MSSPTSSRILSISGNCGADGRGGVISSNSLVAPMWNKIILVGMHLNFPPNYHYTYVLKPDLLFCAVERIPFVHIL